jgi:diphosphomevalonate decarboxylase
MINDFVFNKIKNVEGISEWRSPSNIALIKYWGKKENQIPLNSSLSITLSKCFTQTKLTYRPKINNEKDFTFLFEGAENISFEPKLSQFLKRIEKYCPYLNYLQLKIESRNSFPHSSGIASSASSYSALALCIMDIEKKINPQLDEKFFLKKASFLARLGSGSASRSVIGSFSIWGKSKYFEKSTDLFAIKYSDKVHKIFNDICDTVLVVDKNKKEVSSTVGHQLMDNHSFSFGRLAQAENNMGLLKNALKNGNYDAFIELVELEALTLHAMMLTSKPYFILIKPNTLEIINLIWNYRKKNSSKVCFTLDAGANIHLLYPKREFIKIQEFIKNELSIFCDSNRFINDRIGNGPFKL